MKNPPILNDGKIYVVTLFAKANRVHLGDYRTFEEAFARARVSGADNGPDREPGGLRSATYDAPAGGQITIEVEFVDPLLR